MNVTIYGTFPQQDYADFAIGRLRQEVSGLHSIHTMRRRSQAPIPATFVAGSLPQPPIHPITLRIVCDPASANRVRAVLHNMHGYRVTQRP